MIQTCQKIREFCQRYPQKEFSSKSIFLTPTTSPNNFYFLEEGYVRNFITSNDGEELSINVFSPDNLLPLITFYNGNIQACFFFETLTTSTLRIIPQKDMLEMLKTDFVARNNFSEMCVYNINLLLNRTKQLIYSDTNYRIISTLITLAESLGDPDESEFNLNLSHELIASFAGTTRETVTRKLNELKEKGFIISNYNNLKILRIDELKSLLSSS